MTARSHLRLAASHGILASAPSTPRRRRRDRRGWWKDLDPSIGLAIVVTVFIIEACALAWVLR